MRAVAVELDRLGRGHGPREVRAGHGRLGVHRFRASRRAELGREDPAPHRARVADVAHQLAGVDAADRGHAGVAQPIEPPALGVGGILAVLGLAHDDGARVGAIGLHGGRADAVVADERVGEGDDLAGVGGIGDGLLIAGHRGVEDDLAGDRIRGAA